MSATLVTPPANAPAPKLLTAEEFFLLPGGCQKEELVRGEVVASPVLGMRHGTVKGTVGSLLGSFARTQPNRLVAFSTGVITERDPDSVRGPDVSYWDIPLERFEFLPTGYLDQAPLLCVEVLTPSSTRKDLEEKLKENFWPRGEDGLDHLSRGSYRHGLPAAESGSALSP